MLNKEWVFCNPEYNSEISAFNSRSSINESIQNLRENITRLKEEGRGAFSSNKGN